MKPIQFEIRLKLCTQANCEKQDWHMINKVLKTCFNLKVLIFLVKVQTDRAYL